MHDIKMVNEMFEDQSTISKRDWVELFDANIIELEMMCIMLFGVFIESAYKISEMQDIEELAANYGILNMSQWLEPNTSIPKTQVVRYIGPTITLDWFEHKLIHVKNTLHNNYNPRSIVFRVSRNNLNILSDARTRILAHWKALMQD